MIRLLVIGIVLIITVPLEAQVRNSLTQKLLDPDNPYKKQVQTLDSILGESTKAYGKLKLKVDSVEKSYARTKSKIQHNLDSLNRFKFHTTKITHKLDSLNQQREQRLITIKSKADSIKASTIDKINQLNLPPELQTKVKEYTSLLDKVDLSIPSADLKIPSLNLSDQLKGLPNLSIPDLKNPIAGGLPNVTLPSVSSGENIGQATEQLQSLQSKFPRDITNVDQLGKTAESELSQIDEVKALKEELGNVPANPLTSEEEAKKQLMNQAKEVAIDHFADKGEALKAAMDKISKYKQKFSNINSLSEITKRPPNPMKGKPFIERVVPGIQFQIQNKNGNLLVDFNVYFGYRFTGRLTSGIGWNQRVAYTKNINTFNPNARVFGPRAYGEFKLGRGFSPRLEIETMNTVVPPFVNPNKIDIGKREWVFCAMVGIKKEYRFYKNIKGTTTIMFNLFNHMHNKPYVDAVNARFGFEFLMKKKRKK